MKKNDILELDIIDNGIEFEGVAKENGTPIFVPLGIKGEKAEIKVLKVNKNFAYGKIESLLKSSEYRITPICNSYAKCGGCDAMHIAYEYTLDIKRDNVINTLRKQNIDVSIVEDIYGMGNPYNYRNKVQYPTRFVDGKNVIGMFSKRSHDIINIDKCFIQDSTIDEISKKLFNILIKNGFNSYDEKEGNGDIKNIMVRRGIHTGEIMCVIVCTRDIEQKLKDGKVIEEIIKIDKNIKSIVLNINKENTNVILSNINKIVYGEEYITDYIGEYNFKISANSFFQVNTIQAEVLYNILKENLKLEGTENLLELYSGVGSIGIFLSDRVQNVTGVEIVKEAVEAAKSNVEINKLKNIQYICNDAKLQIDKFEKENTKFDVVVVDPPRKGLEKEALDILLKTGAKKIGYISCNPATFARDLTILKEKYKIQNINLVDMFPWTSHVESVSVLHRKTIEK